MSDAALALTGIVRRFGRTLALDHADFTLRAGSVHALLGENGAGKTTLMRVAFGLTRPDAGTVEIGGAPVHLRGPGDAIALGVGMVHQHFTNVEAMTVAENVALGGHGRYDRNVVSARVRELGERTGLRLDPNAMVSSLPVGAQQRLEIVKALARGARTLILDEPTAVLAPAESRELLAWLRSYADSGNSVVLITHKLAEALSVVDEVTVLRRGRTVLHRPAAEVSAATLARAMLGEELTIGMAPVSAASDRVVFRADRLTINDAHGRPRIAPASFVVKAGELVGIAAVEGAGHHELLRALAGRIPVSGGTLERPETVGFVPEDRHRDAVILDFTITENVALRGAGARTGRMRWQTWRDRARALVRDFDVRAAGADAPLRSLSGGNQQKLVLARELADSPAGLVVENATRGLDVRASQAIHERLREAASRGMAVVAYSSDLDEVLSLATRLLVVHAGRLREVPLDREAAGNAMLGLD